MRAASRAAAALAAAAAVVVLSGCDVEGRVDVAAGGVAVDLLITHAESADRSCDRADLPGGITREVARPEPGTVSCHLTGAARLESGVLPPYSLATATVTADLATVSWLPTRWVEGPRADRVTVDVTLPGEVLAASTGTVRGAGVHLDDPEALWRSGAHLVARTAPSPLGPWLWGAGAFATGVAATLAAARLAGHQAPRPIPRGRRSGSQPSSDSASANA